MTLYEQQSSQRQWQNRLEQERRNISASVEETLSSGVYNIQEEWHEEYEDYKEEAHEGNSAYSPAGESAKSRALIPPRLSLQSKMLPALRSESFVQSATAAHAAFQRESQEKLTEQRQTAGQTNIFARLAQRLTSSFAALSLPSPSVSSEQSGVPATETPRVTQLPQEQPYRRHEPVEQRLAPRPSSTEFIEKPAQQDMKVIDAIPATPSTRPLLVPQTAEPQRLGHTTKVRLQAPPLPQTSPLPVSQQRERTYQELCSDDLASQEKYPAIREPVVVQVRVRDVSQVTTRPDLPAIPASIERKQERVEREKPTHATIFGTDAFEGGQAEVMVLHSSVQATSVVHVTLTSNPGQTLVQYVSLHPETGFTVHLTAPASSRTTFNYALLVPAEGS